MTKRVAQKLSLILAGFMLVAMPVAFCQAGATQKQTAQQAGATDTKLPEFEVVSIKPDKSGTPMIRIMFTPDGFSATNASLKLLVSLASGIREDLISGGPSGLESARYDVDAKVAGPDVAALRELSFPQRSSMLQPFLADRFKLAFHKETKLLTVYNLTIAKGGPKLHEAKPDDTYLNGIKGPDGVGHAGMIMRGPDKLNAQGIPISRLTDALAQQLQRTVVDKTGLTGKYDIALKWTPDEQAKLPGPGNDPHGADSAPPSDSSGPSFFTAIQEQLGLKLESAKGPVEVLMIDHAEPPSAN